MRYADPGDRVELIHVDDAFTGLVPGDRGTVTKTQYVRDLNEHHIWIAWDTGSNLTLIPEAGDQFTVVQD